MRTHQILVMFLAIVGSLSSGFWLFQRLDGMAVEVTSESTPEATALYHGGGPFPTFPLMCPKDMLISDGPTWRTVTVGRSSLDDIENIYDVRFTAESGRSGLEGNFAPTYSILLTAEGANKWKLPQSADLCLVDGKII